MNYLLGIDIGTSGTKAVLFDLAGKTIASATAEYPLYQPKNGWAEQEPTDWWKAVCEVCRAILAKSGIDKTEIAGVGLSGQMHGLVILDENDQVIRPSIIWCDQRTTEQAAYLNDLVGAEKLLEITANPALPYFTASKLLWVRQHEPENFAKIKKIMLPKDYIRYMLTGEFATEVSDASGMQMMNIKERDFSPYMLDKLEISRDMVGKMYESCEMTGKITAKAAEATSLALGTPVAGGAGDQEASAVGCGIVREGIMSATIGTSGVVFAHINDMLIDPNGRVHTFCHAVPGAWHIMGVTQGAGLSFKWLRDNFFAAECETADLLGVNANKLLDDISATVPVGSNKLLYLPYLMGERTPHLDSDARGVFFGLSAIHTKKEIMRSVLEGVTYSLMDCLEIIRSMGVSPECIFAAGGGANSKLWRQILADVFGVRIAVGSTTEGGALGVAILAGVCAGVYKDVVSASEMLVHETTSLSPIPENVDIYKGYYELYNKLYPSLKENFKDLAKL